MLVKAGKDDLAHIRRPGTGETWCGKWVNIAGSTKNCELCDRCLDAVSQAEQDKSRSRQAACPVA
jgi:hypothetical protein